VVLFWAGEWPNFLRLVNNSMLRLEVLLKKSFLAFAPLPLSETRRKIKLAQEIEMKKPSIISFIFQKSSVALINSFWP